MTEHKILGTHKGISLVRKEDGSEFYYSTKSCKTAISIRGLARLVGCDAKTVHNAIKSLETRCEVNWLKTAEMYTPQGVQGVKLILEEGLPEVLEELTQGRKTAKTKEAAANILKKLAHAGFRLMVLMEVAPEVVAKEAIANIDDPIKARDVAVSAAQQTKYLESFWGLQDAIQKTGASHPIVNGHNNKLTGVEKGKRNQADSIQKRMLTILQTAEELMLEQNQATFETGDRATEAAVTAGTKTAHFIANLIAK